VCKLSHHGNMMQIKPQYKVSVKNKIVSFS
jgi:hypothetical protein